MQREAEEKYLWVSNTWIQAGFCDWCLSDFQDAKSVVLKQQLATADSQQTGARDLASSIDVLFPRSWTEYLLYFYCSQYNFSILSKFPRAARTSLTRGIYRILSVCMYNFFAKLLQNFLANYNTSSFHINTLPGVQLHALHATERQDMFWGWREKAQFSCDWRSHHSLSLSLHVSL